MKGNGIRERINEFKSIATSAAFLIEDGLNRLAVSKYARPAITQSILRQIESLLKPRP